jgi:hypothetical protein
VLGEMKKGMMELDLRKLKMDLRFGQMEMNDGLKTNEYDNLNIANDFKMVDWSFGLT